MFTLFLIGNIASGKSTASRYLESRGAFRIDLDELAKSLYVPGSPVLSALAERFGDAVLTLDGELDRKELAARAFASEEATQALNDIVHPVLIQRLSDMLVCPLCVAGRALRELAVVEISVAASFTQVFNLADEIMCISVPLAVRRARAIARGMDPEDFDNRAARQPADEELAQLADTVIDNTAADDTLFSSLDVWLSQRGLLAHGATAKDGR